MQVFERLQSGQGFRRQQCVLWHTVGLPFIEWRVTKKVIEKGSSVWFDIAIRDSVHLHYMKEHPGEELTDMLLNDWGWDDLTPAALDAFAISEPEVSWHEYGR